MVLVDRAAVDDLAKVERELELDHAVRHREVSTSVPTSTPRRPELPTSCALSRPRRCSEVTGVTLGEMPGRARLQGELEGVGFSEWRIPSTTTDATARWLCAWKPAVVSFQAGGHIRSQFGVPTPR